MLGNTVVRKSDVKLQCTLDVYVKLTKHNNYISRGKPSGRGGLLKLCVLTRIVKFSKGMFLEMGDGDVLRMTGMSQ